MKAGTAAAGWPRRRISGLEWQAGQRAEAILADAQAEAQALRRDAEREAAGRREEAARLGHAEGLAQAAAVLVRAEARRAGCLAGAEAEVVELGLEVARRLLGRELALDPGAVRGSAEAVLAAARGRRRATLRLHPAAAAALHPEVAALASLGGWARLALQPDPTLQPGDAVVETEGGAVDGRLEVRLEAFRRALVEPGA